MIYRNIVEKYLHYMSNKNFLSGEEELILRASLINCQPDLNYKRVYETYCKGKIIMIPLSYWNKEEITVI